jgi:hypothetical protein
MEKETSFLNNTLIWLTVGVAAILLFAHLIYWGLVRR